ncbi:uncharacterized protein TNCV_2031581 [Trichonephila clavipes]|nr:uncharacterized protein TNCV_2031581 [Trichonephila clavipes]
MYFDELLTSESYTEILPRPLADFLEDEVSLRDFSCMWYQHDVAPVHKSVKLCAFLAQTFDTRIIGYGERERSTGIPTVITRHKSSGFISLGLLNKQSVRTGTHEQIRLTQSNQHGM